MMVNIVKNFILSLLLLAVTIFAAQSPVATLNATANQMIGSLKQNRDRIKHDPTVVENLARQILLPHVDINIMARLALGRDGWNNATVAEREQFIKEFTIVLIRTYASAFAAYRDEEVKFYPIRGGIHDQTRVQVESVIIQKGGPSIPVNYRLLLRGDQWKVYDINVDGVSMVQSFRSQFTSELSQGGMVGLLNAMQKHNARQK